MAFGPVVTALVLCVGFDLLAMVFFPALRFLVDPLLLLLIPMASRIRSPRSLWLTGLGLGLVKDLYAGSVFGAWTFTFAAAAWLISATRQMVEWEDPAIVGIWAAILTLLVWVFYGFWMTVADPFIHWGNGQLSVLPAAMAAQGLLAAWLYPRMRKWFLKSSPVYRI